MEVILVVFPRSSWHYSECGKGRRGAASVLLTFKSEGLTYCRWPERHRAFWLWQTWALWLREKGKKNLRRWWVGLRQEEPREIWEHVKAFPLPMTKYAESLFVMVWPLWCERWLLVVIAHILSLQYHHVQSSCHEAVIVFRLYGTAFWRFSFELQCEDISKRTCKIGLDQILHWLFVWSCIPLNNKMNNKYLLRTFQLLNMMS